MKTPAGLIETDCGWVFAVACVAPNQVRLVIQFDPDRENLTYGVKDLRLSEREAFELETALRLARQRSGEMRVIEGGRP